MFRISCLLLSLSLATVLGNHVYEWKKDHYIRRTLPGELPDDGVDRDARRSCKCQCKRKWNNFWSCCECLEGCFPESAKVRLEGGKVISMAEVRPGHRVQAVDADGAVTWSEVRAFMKRQPSDVGEYIVITTETGHMMSLSPSHVIFASESNFTSYQSRYARDVDVGDYVFTLDVKRQKLMANRVTGVDKHMMKGVYVPLTWHGTLLVDDVYASCYASFNHEVAHLFMTPMRYLPTVFDHPWQSAAPRQFVEVARKIGHMILPSGLHNRETNMWTGGLGLIRHVLESAGSWAAGGWMSVISG